MGIRSISLFCEFFLLSVYVFLFLASRKEEFLLILLKFPLLEIKGYFAVLNSTGENENVLN